MSPSRQRNVNLLKESNSEVDDVRLCVRIADKVNPPKMEEPDERDSETMEIKGNVAPIKRW